MTSAELKVYQTWKSTDPFLPELDSTEMEHIRTWVRNSLESDLSDESREMAYEVRLRFHIQSERENKAKKLFRSAYGKLVGERFFPEFTTKSFRQVLLEIGHARSVEKEWDNPFTIDEDNKRVFNTLCLYFTNNPKFESIMPSFSLKKGILLVGPLGVGKNEMMQLFSDNPKLGYTRHATNEVVQMYARKDVGSSLFTEMVTGKVNTKSDSFFGHRILGRNFNDLGKESMGNHMGNFLNVMGEIITLRWDYAPRWATHFTSNYTVDQLAEKYDGPTMDRLKSMCNVLEYPPGAVSRR